MSQLQGVPYARTRRAGNKFNQIDIKEILVKEMYSQGSSQDSANGFNYMGPSTAGPSQDSGPVSGGSGPLSASVGFADTYTYFDSNARNFGASSLNQGQIAFTIPQLNSGFPIENIVAMRINSFYIPSINNATTIPNYFFFGRVYLRLTSSSLPSNAAVEAQNNNFYHFEMAIDNFTSVALLLEPVRDVFYFDTPIQSLSDLTLNFYRQPNFSAVSLPNDTIVVLGLAGTNPAQFQVISSGDTTAPIAPVGVPAAPGVAVYISNFVSPSSTLNTQVNSLNGYFVDNVISTTVFSISQLDFTTLGVNTQGTVMIAKNRIAVEIEFLTVKPVPTNNLVGVHN